MQKKIIPICIALAALLIYQGCKKEYLPPGSDRDLNYLVVDGFINATPGAETVIKLSRTRKINDSDQAQVPEYFASVSIESDAGDMYNLFADTIAGTYKTPATSLQVNKNYRLNITTADGKNYVSDFVPVKQPPPIDTITWKQDNDVSIFVSTTDPANSTRYYLWNYTETWEYHSRYDSRLAYDSGKVIPLDDDEHRTICYRNAESFGILTGSSAALSDDRISDQLLAVIPNGVDKMSVRYSILVRQMGLTEEAHIYWELVKNNSEQVGGLFDPLPSQISGNIRCTSNPDDIVIGYASASTVQEKRIFINNSELTGWYVKEPGVDCTIQFIAPETADVYCANNVYSPIYFITGPLLAIAKTECVDCRTKGGSLTKPSFW